MGDTAPNIDVVIVNWNSGSHLRECLAALDQSTHPSALNVIIVDNASTDGSAIDLKAEKLRYDLASNNENRGFAAACNQGAKRGSSPLILFLNPDVRVTPDAVSSAARCLNDRAQSNAGILGIQLLDANGHVQRCCARAPSAATLLLRTLFLDRICPGLVLPHFLTDWDHGDTRGVDQVMGAFLMIRRVLFEKLGGFDERFFLYYEDVDLCLAARQAGSAVIYYAGAQAYHAGGGSSGAVRDRRLFHHAQSRVEYAAKHHGRLVRTMLVVLLVVAEMPARLLHAVVRRSPREGRAVIRGMGLFLHDLPKLWRR